MARYRVGPASGMAILAMKQAIAPVFEARPDYDIFVDLSRRLGFEQALTDWIIKHRSSWRKVRQAASH